MDDFVPWGGAREDGLDEDAEEVHEPEGGCPQVEGLFGAEYPCEGGYDEWEGEVADAVGEPGAYIQDWVRESGEDVGDVCSVECGFECWESNYGYSWSVLFRNVP